MKRHLISSALPYINGIKHLGNLAGSMLPADVHARFRRLQGREVLFICGTDEHGTPAELAARKADLPFAAYCEEQYARQRDVCERFNLSFDYFGRSSSPENHVLTQKLAIMLEENGFIEERETLQLFDPSDGESGRFLPDRYVEGTCPYCAFPDARGDQCDSCGAIIDAVDLLRPRSKVTGSDQLEPRRTKHLFLLQSKLSEKIAEWVTTCTEWPDFARSNARKWLKEGLRDRPITRDLSWGIDVVDKDGNKRQEFENKVYYVWFDAPIAYIAITQEWAKVSGGEWERWWKTGPGSDDVSYAQFMGQDNLTFHTVSFPATILGSGAPLRLVDRLKAFCWLQWDSKKASTSGGVGIFMDQALEMYPADYWRWYLTANAPENSDHNFKWSLFAEASNKDLADKFGNLISRVIRLSESVPDGDSPDQELTLRVGNLVDQIADAHDAMQFRRAADRTRELWDFANIYVSHIRPWEKERSDSFSTQTVLRNCLELLRICAVVALPIIPAASARALRSLGVDPDGVRWPASGDSDLLRGLTTGARLSDPGRLFEKVELPAEET